MAELSAEADELERAWVRLRDRILYGCQLEHLVGSAGYELNVRVLSYFGEVQQPPPVLILSREMVVDHLSRAARQGGGGSAALNFAAAVLATNLDEEFEADHGDDRRLRNLGLRRDRIGRVTFFAEVW